MERAIVVIGTLSDPTHIELDEPLTELQGPVEVVVRRAEETRHVRIPQGLNFTAGEKAFDAWIDGHDRTVPLPSPESLRRERASIHYDKADLGHDRATLDRVLQK